MTLMPAHTDRMHLDPYWLGDSPRAIRRCARRLPGRRYIDINLQRCKNGVVCMHWATPERNGYTYILKADGKRRKMTYEERHRRIQYWTTAEVLRWRRTKYRGSSYASRVKVMTYEQAVRMCKRYYVKPCFELKSYSFGDKNVAKAMVNYAHVYGRVVFYMTLATMPNWRRKGTAIKAAGGHIALLAHGAPKPDDLERYVPEVFDRVWGHWAA